jgi:hypothetical protein
MYDTHPKLQFHIEAQTYVSVRMKTSVLNYKT